MVPQLSIQWVQKLKLQLLSLLTLMVVTSTTLKPMNQHQDPVHTLQSRFIKKLTEVKGLVMSPELIQQSLMQLLVQMLTIKIQKKRLYCKHLAMDSVLQNALKASIQE